jgi:hypothetical protein
MSIALILKLLISALTTATIAGVVWWARKHPNRSKEYPEQQRMPKFVPAVGWLFLVVGSLMGLLSFATDDVPLGAKISSVAIVLGGVAFLMMYRNFYVAVRDFEVAFRSVLGNEHVIAYSDITKYSVQMMKGMPFLTVKSVHGATLNLNISTYDMSPLMRAIDFHRVTGNWPVRVEVSGL